MADKDVSKQVLLEEYTNRIRDVEDHAERATKLQELANRLGIPYRSAITYLVHANLYKKKPPYKKVDRPSLTDSLINRYADPEKSLEATFGSDALANIDKYANVSKELIIKEIEEYLGLPTNSLYSLKAATKLSLVALLLGI